VNRKTKKVHEIKGPDLRGESQDVDSVAQAARLDRELRDDQLNAVSGGFGNVFSSISKAVSGV
jgi:hypothetical protein